MNIGDSYNDEENISNNTPADLTDELKEEINAAWEEYDNANADVIAAKQTLDELIEKRGIACKTIALLKQKIDPGKKKIRHNGRELTIVVRPRNNGDDLYFFRGAKEKDILDM
jgi:hypothetical protein